METVELVPHNEKPISDLDAPAQQSSGCSGLVITTLAVSAVLVFLLGWHIAGGAR